MNINLLDKLRENKILPIIRNTDPQKVHDIACAILDGGVDVMEITIENPRVLEVIEKLSQRAFISAGGVITSRQAQVSIMSGAKSFSSPILQVNLVKISKDAHVPYIAGASTANEAYQAWKSRIPAVKIYPATALGGHEYIKNMLRPMPLLNLIPQGSVKLDDVEKYIEAGALAVGVGRNLTEAASYGEITKRILKFKSKL